MHQALTRRAALKRAGLGLSALAAGPTLLSIRQPLASSVLIEPGALRAPDRNGVRLPEGFVSRIVACSGFRVRRSRFHWLRHRWHIYPDGGATFATPDGGWVYVSNSESPAILDGGAGVVRFDSAGRIVDAYTILKDTNFNCAGGPTPWGTWLSCEEIPFGRVWECDVLARRPERRDALGYFKHEAAAVDPVNGHVYLTEDEKDGRLYRFVPSGFDANGWPRLDQGELQVALVDELSGYVFWEAVPEPRPRASETATRYQVDSATVFNGGEGCWYADAAVYFTTKGDNRVWKLDVATQILEIIYDVSTSPTPELSGVDNITVSEAGDVLVAEDGGDMQIVIVHSDGTVSPLLQIPDQRHSELTGPAFSPDGSRLYFSSQRGNPFGDSEGLGITYEVSGPFVSA